MIFKGSGVALITPFDNENNINYKKLEQLLEFQIENKTDSIIICGTTGESATLSLDEKKKLIKYTVEVVNKRIPVIAGTGSNNTKFSIELSKYAKEVNADGLLIVTPYYNKCSKQGLYEHYKAISDSVSLPIIAYNVPSRTGLNIEPDTLVKLSTIENIVAIKEASSNISQISEMFSKIPNNFNIYSGNDDQIIPILSLGGAGVISVLANIMPKQTHDICYNYFDGKIELAKNMQLKYFDLIKKLFIEVNPAPIKEAMNYLGYNVGKTRLPLCELTENNKKLLKESITKLALNMNE